MNSLIDYFGRETVSINGITFSMLLPWERYLKTDRVHVWAGNQGQDVTTNEKGMKAGGIYNKMRDLRTLFNSAKLKFNDDELVSE
jgi:hypothetical protein